MKKIEITNTIDDTKLYKGKEVKGLINSVTAETLKPLNLKYGDVFLNNVGRKKRPVCIIKVLDDLVLGIPLTTTEDKLAIGRYDSRFLGQGSFTKQVISVPFEYALSNYFCILDDFESLEEIHQQIKQFYNKNL